MCSLLVLVGLLISSPVAAANELMLHTNFLSEWQDRDISGLMCRELARQALLIAAREEIGMQTCDMTLREQSSTGDPLELLLTVQPGKQFKVWVFDSGAVDLRDTPPATDENIHESTFTVTRSSIGTYPTACKELEEASRGEFTQFLRDLGAKRTVLAADENVDLEIDIAALQAEVDLVSQFVAVRELHRRYRVEQSAETLQALVRGYANLGLLNETNWGASSIALQARALLYSARLESLHPEHPETLWTLAYANSIVGLHYRSLEQLETLENTGSTDDLPPWTALVGAYSRFEVEELERLSKEDTPISDWAAYLNAWTVFNSLEHRRFTSVGRSAIEACPEAMNLYYMHIDSQPIGVMRLSNATELSALLYSIPARLIATPTIPQKVVEAARSPDRSKPPGVYWRSMVDALRVSGGDGDTSWAMLASLLDEQAMRAAYNSMAVNRRASTEVDLTPVAEMWQSFIQGHPDQAYIPTVSLVTAGDAIKLSKACGNFRFRDPNEWTTRACWDLWHVKNSDGDVIGRLGAGASSREFTCQSLTRAITNLKPTQKFYSIYIREVRKVAPRSPVALIASVKQAISSEKPISPEQIEKWTASAGDSSAAWHVLALAQQKSGNRLATIDCFRESIRLSPEYDTYKGLADAYARFDMKDEVIPLYEEYLEKVENFGLEHSNVHRNIATYYMRENNLAAAKPHAVNAAQSYSASALRVAAGVCELQKEFDEADKYYEALSKSYPSSSGLDWYLYRLCRDTDDLEAPRKLVDRSLAASPNWRSDKRTWTAIAYAIAERDHQAAFQACQNKAENESNLYTESFLMLTAIQAGDVDAANESKDRLFDMCDQEEDEKPWRLQFRELMQSILSERAESAELNEDELAKQCEKFLTTEIRAQIYKSDRCYFIGKLLQLQGYSQAAKHCFQLGTTISQTPERITWRLCSIELNR
ncbi:putative secreted protein [Rhodopirellula sp. SWK7]|nr:putative secreted protein [Rhodopirellula sp. SWK7]